MSVIIATRNRAHVLPRALDSILAQEGLGEAFDVEIVVVDNASSDETADVVARYGGVRYVRHAVDRGVSASKNTGLRTSRGGYVSFLDDDDEWLPHKLRVQVSALAARPEVGVVYSQARVRSEGAEWSIPDPAQAPSGAIFTAMLVNPCATHHAALLARREAFDKAGEFDESLTSYEDYDLSLRLAFHAPFLFVPGVVTVYNLSPRGLWLTSEASGAGGDDRARVLGKALRLLPDSPETARLRREAAARWALAAATPHVLMHDLPGAWAKTLTALRAHPLMLRDEWARDEVRNAILGRALAAAAPLRVAAELCAQVEAAVRDGGVDDRSATRRALAETWVELACSLSFGPRPSRLRALRAVARAVAHAPCSLAQRRLLRVLIRSVLGRRVDASCLLVHRWLKRKRAA